MTTEATAGRGLREISNENYVFLQKWVHQASGIVLDDGKKYLVDARLSPIVREEGLDSLDDLCNLLRATRGAALEGKVVDAITTNETLFFRDVAPFDVLRSVVLPELLERNAATRTLRFWSAAASSGQEAYSIAMMLLDMGLSSWKIEICGTDISEQVLERARAGRYLQIEVNRGLPAKFLVRYFDRAGLDWQIKPEVRRLVRFEKRDLRDDLRGLGPYDVVFCRNVLIYFDIETKKKILAGIRGCMSPNAYLSLGAAETTFGLDERFLRKPLNGAVFYQRGE